MRDGFFKSVRGFFNKPNQPLLKEPPKTEGTRVISFNQQKNTEPEQKDRRYDKQESRQSLKQLGIHREAVEGETPILVESKFVRWRAEDGHYEEVTFILSDYQVYVKRDSGIAIHFPVGKIERLQKYTNNEGHFKVVMGLKDGRVIKLRVNTEQMWKKVHDCIDKFAFVRSKQHFFAFRHREANPELEQTFKGWQMYDPLAQMERMGVVPMPHTEEPVEEFLSPYKILDNRDGKICPTYPQQIIVPSRIPYDHLVRCSKFRSRSRMPALSFAHKSQRGLVGLWRSSQSKVGVSNSRSPEDELMLKLIGNPQLDFRDNTPQPVNCIIYDARNKMAAIGNKVAGKGYEYQQYYPNCKIEFLNIPNIHAVRESYQKAQKAALGDDARFYTTLAQSEWYDYVFVILQGASSVAKSLSSGKNVLVHCSDGWDRTSQLCALVGLLLDPYYRTMEGFQILVDKDWIRFGHQFGVRMGQGVNNPQGEDKSPVFLQFLDCVSQLLYQFPTDFQFNYRYLGDMCDLAQCNLYGNFLCNCELQMNREQTPSRTVSMWSYFLRHKDTYTNPYYGKTHHRIHPSTAQKHFRFWKEHFLQHVEQFHDIYDIYSCKFTEDNLQIMYKHLKQEKTLLQQKILQNSQLLEKIGEEISSRSQLESES